MKLITKKIYAKLLENGRMNLDYEGCFDPRPVMKLFTPDANCTWLLTEILPHDEDIAFGLCDLGMGCPELGTVRLSELAKLRGRLGLPVERDRHFKARHRLSVYAYAAKDRIVEDADELDRAALAYAAETRARIAAEELARRRGS